MSGRKFAAKLGKSPTTVNEYLHGRTPPADFIERVCERFKVDANWLLTGEEKEKPAVVSYPEANYSHRLSVKDLIGQHLDQMDEEAQRDVLKYVEQAKCYAEYVKKEKKRG